MRLRSQVAFLLLATTFPNTAGMPAALAHEVAPRRPTPRELALTPTPSLPAIRAAPDFALPDVSSRVVRLSELRGRIVLVSFIYANCSTACPLVTGRLARLQERLQRARLSPPPHLVSITVDPERDTADVLRGYAERFGADPRRWHFLRAEPARLAPVLAAYDEWTRRQPNGDIDHPARLYLIDPRGTIREIYSLAFFDDRQAELDIRALLHEAR